MLPLAEHDWEHYYAFRSDQLISEPINWPIDLSWFSSKPISLKAFHISTLTALPSSTNILLRIFAIVFYYLCIKGKNLIYQFSSFRGFLDDPSIVMILFKCCFLLFFDWAYSLVAPVIIWMILVIGCFPNEFDPLPLTSSCLLLGWSQRTYSFS